MALFQVKKVFVLHVFDVFIKNTILFISKLWSNFVH
jgi:hypothetical protein